MSAVYVVVCRLLELVVLLGRRERTKELEILFGCFSQHAARRRYVRIVGELRKLGITISATSVRNILNRRAGLPPAPQRDRQVVARLLARRPATDCL